ncbi:MAG: Crp/Fnr family transcriptional regulator [Candidatus Sumerlaeota bacterium]|nr:Crp/Fnr family transcriptional regulator [Candidatus Sumerlaeota bacterium]
MGEVRKRVSAEELGACFLFQGLTAEQRANLARAVVRKAYARARIIFAQGAEADGFYVLRSGAVKVFRSTEDGREAALHVVQPDDLFGAAAMFMGFAFPASAQTLSRSEVWFIPRRAFFDALARDMDFVKRILANFALRLSAFAHRFESLTADTLETRLVKWMLGEFGREGPPVEGRTYRIRMPKNGLAALLGATPETLSRALRSLSDARLIRVQGPAVALLNLRALREKAGDE